MEGTVTISLEDFEELKHKAEEQEKIDNYYLKLAIKQVELLEKIEDFFQGEKIATGLAEEINLVLSNWYG